ncbi:C4-dicarboxylate TRAP transporter substrate-binding protein [Pseudoclavibacter terrae]|uniref:C4-dicarboxylate TRAP transporter substrate-binding protein n=1 Tax=Pseudoclavibacter terrae TaxID=1530195 RepID=UPI00232F30DD|nr:C4-dicarboxylate TRAP transporter substrate-binding protein [Pseudoclavibacter terrae]
MPTAKLRANVPRAARVFTSVALLGLVASGLAACSSAERDSYVLHYTTYSGQSSDQSKTVQRWAEDVEERTAGGVTVEFHYSESLVGADESVQAALDGRADLAQVGSIYAASDLPMFTAVELPFETQNPEVQMTAIERLYEESEQFRADFDRQGVRLLFPLPLGISLVGSKTPVESVEDLAGMSIRSGGLTSQAMLSVGANPVAMTATDIYESMERGIVDGYTALAIANLPTFALSDTTPYVVNNGIGSYSSSIVIVNEELFQSMPTEYQNALLGASEDAIEMGLEEMDTLGQQSCDDLRASGTEFSAFDEAEVTAWKDSAAVSDAWVDRYAARDYDSQAVLDEYRAIIAEETPRSDYRDPLIACAAGTGA